MRSEEFYLNLNDPSKTLAMLEDWGLLPDLSTIKCEKCEGGLKIRTRLRKGKPKFILRCVNCDSEGSLFKNTFFTFQGENGRCNSKLDVSVILRLIFAYFECKTTPEIMEATGIKSTQTVVNWTNFIREKISNYLNNREQLGGSNETVESDESDMGVKKVQSR